MKKELLLMTFLLCASLSTALDVINTDDFGVGVNCSGTQYDCGTTTDRIVLLNGKISVNITDDDGLATYYCATQIDNGNAFTKTCIIRAGFNLTICDDIIAATAPGLNKSYLYNCTSTNLSTCGWNGIGAIPYFATGNPSTQWQIDSANTNGSTFSFIEYICNDTPKVSIQGLDTAYVTTTTKGAVCTGDQYKSVVYSSIGPTDLSAALSCVEGFCSISLEYNLTNMSQAFNQTLCTGGCHNFVLDGSETDVDYGGIVCGNCTPDGKINDAFYEFARDLQEENTTILSNTNHFNSNYCAIATESGTAGFGAFLFILILSVVMIIFMIVLIVLILFIILLILATYIKNKLRRK